MIKVKQFILTITFTIIFIICWFSNSVNSELVCGPAPYVLNNMESRFGEKQIARGVDQETSMILIITANTLGDWSLLVSPASNPRHLCVPITGKDWLQQRQISSGTAYDGSTLTIHFDREGNFKVYWLDQINSELTLMITGYDWQRFWEFDKSL
tara:strand:- start:1374 stop:1835 length:462 start_codon:yes stop_codon:yes gene_type:complete